MGIKKIPMKCMEGVHFVTLCSFLLNEAGVERRIVHPSIYHTTYEL